MSEQGLLYDSAVERLVGKASRAGAIRAELAAQLTAFKRATTAPTAEQITELERDLLDLEASVPAIEATLRDAARLEAKAAGRVRQLATAVGDAVREGRGLIAVHTPTDPPADAPFDAGALAGRAERVLVHLAEVQRHLTVLTIAWRIRTALGDLRVGQAYDVKANLADELPTDVERREALQRLKDAGGYLANGVVDVEHDRVWCKSPSQAKRIASWFALPVALALLLGVLLLVAETELLARMDPGEVPATYGLVVLGVVANLLFENVKQALGKTVGVLAVGELLDWLHLRWLGLAGTAIPVAITAAGLLATGIEPTDSEGAALCFFAGYSVDSVAGTFLTRFGTSSARRVKDVEARVKG